MTGTSPWRKGVKVRENRKRMTGTSLAQRSESENKEEKNDSHFTIVQRREGEKRKQEENERHFTMAQRSEKGEEVRE